MAAQPCETCGKRHTSAAAIARCAEAAGPALLVEPEDVAGVLGLLDGRLVLTRSGGVLAVGHSLPWGPAHPGQFATGAEVFGELVRAGADGEVLKAKLLRNRRVGLPLSQAIPSDAMAVVCKVLSARAVALKSAA